MAGVKYVGMCIATTVFCTIVLWHSSFSDTKNAEAIPETDPRDTVWVPDDYNTVQAGIDACPRGGTVMVRPGIYHENVAFHGRPIRLIGLEGADSTIIDAPDSSLAVVWFDADDEYVSRIEGFTVRGGLWGIRCFGDHQQPYGLYIVDNIVEGNAGGIGLHAISAWVQGNIIRYNYESGGLATIAEPMIVQNVITENWGYDGGGVTIWFDSAQPVIGGSPGMGNVIANNVGTIHPWGHDIYQQVPGDPIDARYNTWTVYPPTEYTMHPLAEFDTTGGVGSPRIDQDVYVSPLGDNDNSGLDPSHPLRNIHNAFARLVPPMPSYPLTVHLGFGVYSFATNMEQFPVVVMSNVRLTGDSMDSVVVDASGYPGGFRAEDCDHIVLANLTIQQAGSAAITVEQGQYHQFRNLYIHHNQGGMVVRGINSMLISNCVFAWNERDLDGGALYMEESTGDLINCVMYHNVTQGLGGGVACLYSGMLRVMNCILWNNVAGVICPDIYGSAIPVIVVTYTDITQGWTGLGNITLDPEFQDTTEFLADFHLRTGSPCIDAGNPAPEYNDPDGSRNDMGVYGGPWGEGWVGVGGGYWSSAVPQDFGIVSLYPNPANPNAMIQYRIPVQGHVRLQVYNVLGQEVTIVIDQPQSAGEYSVVVGSEEFASGVYFCRLHCDMPGGIRQISARKLLILR